jgi:hypothetical protein
MNVKWVTSKFHLTKGKFIFKLCKISHKSKISFAYVSEVQVLKERSIGSLTQCNIRKKTFQTSEIETPWYIS